MKYFCFALILYWIFLNVIDGYCILYAHWCNVFNTGKRGKDSPDHLKSVSSKSPAKAPSKQELSTDKGGPRKGPGGYTRSTSAEFEKEKELTSAGPVADPLNKELERWQKGKTRIQAVTKWISFQNK